MHRRIGDYQVSWDQLRHLRKKARRSTVILG
nr:hypothetical protein [Actinopolyspora sp. BKK1]